MRPAFLDLVDRVALDPARLCDVSLEIPHGLTAVLGWSGAGKTSLLEVIAGLRSPRSGSVELNGRVISGLRVNETNFNIQLREENGRFHSLFKRDLDEIKVLKKSLMPENFAELLSVKDLHDLFAYLMTLE